MAVTIHGVELCSHCGESDEMTDEEFYVWLDQLRKEPGFGPLLRRFDALAVVHNLASAALPGVT